MKWLLIIFLFTTVEKLYSQDEKLPIVISPLIGDTLTLKERNYYKLFPTIDGFQWSVFYLNSDSSLSAAITYVQDNKTKDTLVELSSSLNKMKQYIHDTEFSKSVIVISQNLSDKRVNF